jgi:hypothetical protein
MNTPLLFPLPKSPKKQGVGHVTVSPSPANVAAKIKSGPTERRRRIDRRRRRIGAGRALTSAAFAAIDVTSNADSAAVACKSLRMIIPTFALDWFKPFCRPQQGRWIARGKEFENCCAITTRIRDITNRVWKSPKLQAPPRPGRGPCLKAVRHATGRPCFVCWTSSFQENAEIGDRLARIQWAAVNCVTFSQSIQRGLSLMKSRF